MNSIEPYDLLRMVLMVGTTIVCVFLVAQLIFRRKTTAQPVVLLKLIVILFGSYMIDAGRSAIQSDTPFRYRLILWTIGLFIAYMYIFMPKSKRHSYSKRNNGRVG